MKQPGRPLRALAATAALIVGFSLATACVSDAGREGENEVDASGVSATGGQCIVSESSRSSVSLAPGTEVYVEPHGFAAFDGGFLIAGRPVLDWTVPESGPATLNSQGELLGVLAVGGEARPIPRPPGVAGIEWLRMVSLGPSLWGFLVQEEPMEREPGRIVYAAFDGSAWSSRKSWTSPRAARSSSRWGLPSKSMLPGTSCGPHAFSHRGQPPMF